MKVAINTRFLLPQLEGIGTFTHEICRRMVLQNKNIEFHFLFDRKFDRKYIYADNIVPHLAFPPARHPILWQLWYEWTIPRYLNKINADVFLSPDNFCSLKTRVPTLMVTHDLAFEHYPNHIRRSHLNFFKRYSKKYHERADRIACVSKFTQQDVIKKYQIHESKTLVTYNGCNESFNTLSDKEKALVKLNIAEGKDYLLFIGALHPRKNISRLVQAFEKFKHQNPSNIKLVLVGRMAWNNGELKSIIKNSVVKEDILQIGHMKNVEGIISSATALCYPSLFEGFGIPILEAFQSGVPVMTSNVSSMPEVAENAALLIDPMDIDALSRGLNDIVNDPQLRNTLIHKGSKRVESFSWDKSAVQIFDALKDIS